MTDANHETEINVVPKDDGWNVFVRQEGQQGSGLTVIYLERDDIDLLIDRLQEATAPPPPKVVVHFTGGPWDGQAAEVAMATAPVFAVGHEIGNHYWLDTKSDPPTYFWDER